MQWEALAQETDPWESGRRELWCYKKACEKFFELTYADSTQARSRRIAVKESKGHEEPAHASC